MIIQPLTKVACVRVSFLSSSEHIVIRVPKAVAGPQRSIDTEGKISHPCSVIRAVLRAIRAIHDIRVPCSVIRAVSDQSVAAGPQRVRQNCSAGALGDCGEAATMDV